MKKTILIVCMALLASTLMSANEKYFQKMSEAVTQFNSSSSIEDFQNTANKFSIIANVESSEWLPLYYQAHCYILISFMDSSGAERKDGYLDQANGLIEKMLELAPEESEFYVMKAFSHTGRLLVNPPARSQTTSPLVSQALGKALHLDPDNPRAMFLKLSNGLGTAQYFGSDTAPYCEEARRLLERWDTYVLKSKIHPAWGKGQVKEIVGNCGE